MLISVRVNKLRNRRRRRRGVVVDAIILLYVLSKRRKDKIPRLSLSFSPSLSPWLFLHFPSGDAVRVIANLVQYAKRISFDVFQKPREIA